MGTQSILKNPSVVPTKASLSLAGTADGQVGLVMTRIAIVSLTISRGDAVGNDVLEMGRVLSARGHHVALFNSHWVKKSEHSRDLAELDDFLAGDPEAVLIYHHLVGWKAGLDQLRRAACHRVVKYHNVTPGRFFAGFPGDKVRICQLGREQLRDLAKANCDLYLSASLYNQGELIDAGAPPERCTVVPPFHHIDRLNQLQADTAVLRRLDDGCTNLLFVGRRAPHKGHRFLIDAFAVYCENYESNSRLLLVGREEHKLQSYSNLLRQQASRLGVLDRVLFIDDATEAELKAYYQCASVFVLASEHEGFCVPLVEAMALQVPIVAYGAAAVPHTVGDAGLVWDEPDPFLLAQSIDTVVRDAAVRRSLTERGWRRYQQWFTNQRIERDFLHALRPLAA
jgi:glycosyltransferase involved in cell wall biosynthesis